METRDSKELLQEFNQKYSLNVPIVEKTNFFGDLSEYDPIIYFNLLNLLN